MSLQHQPSCKAADVDASSSKTQQNEVESAVVDNTASSSADNVWHLGNGHVINQPSIIEFGTKKIRKTDERPVRVSVYDLITAITNVKSNSAASQALLRLQERPTTQMFRFPGSTRHTPVADIATCKKIAIGVLAGARMSLNQKNAVLKALGMAEVILLRTYVEEETLESVIKVFSSLNPEKQFSCGPFRIDLYFPDQKIALECDEHGHLNYNADDEIQRQAFIEAQLTCTFVRYNPHAADFRIVDLIAELMPILMMPKRNCNACCCRHNLEDV